MFRKFHDEHPSDAATDEEDEISADDRQLLRQAGPDARRPLTRSSVKPKLLFQAEIKQRKLDNGEVTEDEDEEESTDVELPIATPSRGKAKMMMRVDDSLQAATPPPTARKAKRGMFNHCISHSNLTDFEQRYRSTPGPESSPRIAPAVPRAGASAAAVHLCAKWTRRLAVSIPRLPCPLTASNTA